MELTAYTTQRIEIATYQGDLLLILHTKQDMPTVCILEAADLDDFIDDLKAYQTSRGFFERFRQRWRAAKKRRSEI